MLSDVIEVVVVNLLLIDNGLEELHADAVAVLPAGEQKLVVDVDGGVFGTVKDDDTERVSPLQHKHINVLGRYSL